MGQLCDSCRRRAVDVQVAQPPIAKPVPNGVVAKADAAAAAAKGKEPSAIASSVAFSSGAQELRKRGVRPKMPGYNDTPLLTVGKQVRILKETGFRQALIEYVNDDGTVDVAYEDGGREDETVSNDVVRPLEGYEDLACEKRMKGATTEEKRQMGIRANAPAYKDTPLLSVGKLVRIKPSAGRVRRAEIEYVDEAAGTVDLRYRPAVEAWPGASVVKKTKEKTEETVPIATVHALEEFEFRKETVWSKLFQDDFFRGITSLKEGADDLLMEVKDYDAALEFYSMAIDKLKEVPHSELSNVIVKQDGDLVLGTVNVADARTQKAFVKLVAEDDKEAQIVGLSLDAFIPVHERQLLLQGSLYANRARIWALLDRYYEADDDLSITIKLQEFSDRGEAWNDCLAKARLLRAKVRLCQDMTAAAKGDVKEALSLTPPKETADIVWKCYRDVEQQVKDKRIEKDMSKFASMLPLD